MYIQCVLIDHAEKQSLNQHCDQHPFIQVAELIMSKKISYFLWRETKKMAFDSYAIWPVSVKIKKQSRIV